MRGADILTASVLFVLGGVVFFDALRLGVGWGTDGPKSGFFPFWLAMIMMASCLGIMAQAARRARAGQFVSREQLGPVLEVLWPATLFVLVTQFIGIYVASALYLGFYMRWVGHNSWRAVIALSICLPVVTFLVFEQWFLVPLPKGPLETWLGY